MITSVKTEKNGIVVELEFGELAQIVNHFSDIKYIAKMIQYVSKGLIRERINRLDSEIDYTGAALAPLAEYTIRMKGHEKILYETGQMKEALKTILRLTETSLSDIFQTLSWLIPQNEEAEYKIRAAIDPDFSSSLGERPVRDFWSFSSEDEQTTKDAIEYVVQCWLKGQ